MNYILFIIFLFNNEIQKIFCKNQNLFEIIKNNYNSNNNYESSYIIQDEIQKFFETKENLFHIPIYISIIDLTNINILNISNSRDSYLNNYNNLLGVSNKVIINSEENKNKNKVIKVFLNGTFAIKNNSNLDDMIYNKIIIEKEDYNIDLYFLKNRYMSQYKNINEQNQKLLKFYDMNILFYNNENILHKDIEKNDLVILKKLENNLTLNEDDYSIIINNCIKDFIKDSYPVKLKNKVSTWLKIRNELNTLLNLKHCKVNLYNYMIIPDIKKIKEKIENIEKNLIHVLFFVENRDNNFVEFNKSINDLAKILKIYNVSQTDEKIDLYFYILTLISMALIIYLLCKISKEFKISYFKKVK